MFLILYGRPSKSFVREIITYFKSELKFTKNMQELEI